MSGFFIFIIFVAMMAYIVCLHATLNKLRAENRPFSSWMIWFGLIPITGWVWLLVAQIKLSNAIKNEFVAAGAMGHKNGAIELAIGLVAVSIAVIVTDFWSGALIADSVLWIMYWVAIYRFNSVLPLFSMPDEETPDVKKIEKKDFNSSVGRFHVKNKKDKSVNKWVSVCFSVLMFIASGIGGLIGRDLTERAMGTGHYAAMHRHEQIAKQMNDAAADLNKKAPMMVDSERRFDGAAAVAENGYVMIYYMTLVSISSTEITINQIANQIDVSSLCEKSKEPFQRGIVYTYIYKGNDGITIGSVDISEKNCPK